MTYAGYHQGCFQHFTKNLNRLPKSPELQPTDVASASHSPRRSSTSSGSKPLFPPECIFYGKLEKKVSRRTKRCTKFTVFKAKDGSFKDPAWKQIEPRALELKWYSLHRMVLGEDLFAREANFHPSCRTSFNLEYLQCTKKTKRYFTETEQDQKAAAHLKAFSVVIDTVNKLVIQQDNIVQLYTEELEKNGLPNPNCRTEKLKARLQNDNISQLITFTKVAPGDQGCITYTLIYSASITIGDAVVNSCKLGSNDKYDDEAKLLCSIIIHAFKESESLPWLPTVNDLDVISADDSFRLI